jgi:tetratricopeptide (TPR) repeat protein
MAYRLNIKKAFSLLFVSLILFSASLAFANSSKDWFERGNAFQNEGAYQDAVEAYEKSAELNPNYWVVYQNLGLAYQKLRNFEKASEAFQKALKLAPDNLDIHLSLGSVYNFLEKWEKAISHINLVVHRRSNDAVAHGNLGWAYFNYTSGPPFRMLTIVNLSRAIQLFEQEGMVQAAEATKKTLEEAKKKFGFNDENQF